MSMSFFFLYTSFIPIERIKVSSKFLLILLYMMYWFVLYITIKLENLLLQLVSLGSTVPTPVQKTVRRDARAQRDVWEGVFRAGEGHDVTNVSPYLTPFITPPTHTHTQFKNLKFKKTFFKNA